MKAGGLIKRVSITPDEVSVNAGAVRKLDEEGNVFLLEFNSKEEAKSNIWSIYFVYGTYNTSKQLEISIHSDTYTPNVDEIYLEKLKLRIKKCINRDWEKIIWLVDKDSECLAVYLYHKIYKIENLMREVINEVMVKQYGISWWDTFVPANIKKKHLDRRREYKTKVPAFNDVDERLMSIDIDDLAVLVNFKRYKWNPIFDEKINALLNGVQRCNDASIREVLFKQRIVETDLWKDQFSKYLPSDFIERYTIFTKDRNHIMHNKLLDRNAFKLIKEGVDLLVVDLVNAIEKIQNEILSNEEKIEIEKQRQIERQFLEDLEHECKENDANVSIRDYDKIESLFRERIEELLAGIEENLRFRNDIEIEEKYEASESNGKFVSVKSRIGEQCITLTYDMVIDDCEGAESVLEIRCNDRDFETFVNYQNGAVEYDDDSGLYMPFTEDCIEDAEDTIDEIVDFINREITSYLEFANPDDFVDYLLCCECGTESICINETVLPVGTCMNCGYVNEVHVCDKCHLWFNGDEDGRVIDEIALCQNCLDKIESE